MHQEKVVLVTGTSQGSLISNGRLKAITRSVASENSNGEIEPSAAGSGIVDMPSYKKTPRGLMKSLSLMGEIGEADEIAGAVAYLNEAHFVTGGAAR